MTNFIIPGLEPRVMAGHRAALPVNFSSRGWGVPTGSDASGHYSPLVLAGAKMLSKGQIG